MSVKRSFIRVASDWLEDSWAEALSGLSAFAFAAVAVFVKDDDRGRGVHSRLIQSLIACGTSYIVFFVLSFREKKRASRLHAEVVRLTDERAVLKDNVRNLLDGYLFNLASHKLKFGTKGTKYERITLYVEDSGRCFVPVGRYASNPDHRSTGRPSYPILEGCIHTAWANGWAFQNDFPDPATNLEEYLKMHTDLGLPRATAERLTMKSRLYCACRIMDQKAKYPVAVVVVESTDPARFTEEYLKKAVADGEQQYLSEIIHVTLPDIALPSVATKAGL